MIESGESVAGQRLSQKQAAELVGLDPRLLRLESNPAPRNTDGTYEPVAVVRWMLNRSGSETDKEIKTEKLRKLKRENDIAENRLIDREALQQHTQSLELAIRELGDGFARKKNLTGKQSQAMLNVTLQNVVRKIESINGTDS